MIHEEALYQVYVPLRCLYIHCQEAAYRIGTICQSVRQCDVVQVKPVTAMVIAPVWS